MPKFILLNESFARGDTKRLLLNADHISHVQEGLNGKDTHIRMQGGNVVDEVPNGNGPKRSTYYFVKESFDEVMKKLSNNYFEE